MKRFDNAHLQNDAGLVKRRDRDMCQSAKASWFKLVFRRNSRVHHKPMNFQLGKHYPRRWRFQGGDDPAIAKELGVDHSIRRVSSFLFLQTLPALSWSVRGHFIRPADEALFREMLVCHFLGTTQELFIERGKDKNG